MKTRREISGLHLFDRVSGVHILLDEISFDPRDIQNSPRIVSIALTNICDLKCHFCYAPKNKETLDLGFLKDLSERLDDIGVLELTFGGGEPILHPHIVELCKWIWNNTSLGISITTHGHRLSNETIDALTGNLSMIRFSIDGVEPTYSKIRGRNLSELLQRINYVKGKIPFGINCVVSKDGMQHLKDVIELSIVLEANNVLIIPEHLNGAFQFNSNNWIELEQLITTYEDRIEILLTYEAANYLKTETLSISHKNEFLFAHISADGKLKTNSFDNDGIEIISTKDLEFYFNQIKKL